MLPSIVISAVFIVYAAIMMVYLFTWKKIRKSSPISLACKNVFVSVIVPVRNEKANILTLLNSLSQQSYLKSCFEVIIVNDHSDDNTFQLVASYKIEHPEVNILLLSLTDTAAKKAAITAGVFAAKGELILTTDADCTFNETWLERIAGYYSEFHPQLIIAPVLISGNDSFFQCFQQYDYMAMQVAGLASAKLGLPLLCSGANLAFQKEAFLAVDGYQGNEGIASGDDTFLFFKMKNQFPEGVRIMVDKHVIVTSTPLPTVKDLIEQRHRWGGKVKSYKNGYVVFMGLTVLIVNFLLLFIGLASFHYQEWLTLFGSCFLLKAVVDFIFLYHAADFFSVKINILNFILSEALLPLFYLWLVLRSMSGTYEWKGRKLKS